MVARWFHLALVRPAGYAHASAFAEALEYLAAVIAACGHRVTRGENALEPGAHNVVACAHVMPAAAMAALPLDTIVLNGEPLDDDVPAAYRALLGRSHVWDYSHANGIGDVIPFWYRAELVRAPVAPNDRVVFYGSVTPHRRAILEGLAARGIAIDVGFGVYGEARDRTMLGARAVLNLHKRAGARAFEPLRCFYPLINGVPVISEATADPTADPFRDAMTFARGVDDLAAAIHAASRARTPLFAARDPLPAIAAAIERYVSYTRSSTSR